MRPSPRDDSLPHVAALCTWWHLAPEAVSSLLGSGVRVAAVAGDFPSGQAALADKVTEIESAVGDGADEIDAVINRETFLSGDERAVYEEIVAFRTAAAAARLKIILETGELESLDAIRHAALVAMAAGADMVKTSTGKMSPGATPEAALVMAEAVKDFNETTGKDVGLKVAGGVRSPEQAVTYIRLVDSVLGAEWAAPQRFRIGASSLLETLVTELELP